MSKAKIKEAVHFAVSKTCSILNLKPEVTSQMVTSVMEAYNESQATPPAPKVEEAQADLEDDADTHPTTGGRDKGKNSSGFGGFSNGAR